MKLNVCIVIVTYNRLKDLKSTLEKYEKQTKMFKSMVVVNNASTDGTLEYLDEWKNKNGNFERIVLHMQNNCGGAGGFSTGISKAMDTNSDYVFLADDDAVPEDNMLEKLFGCYMHLPNKEDIAALCTRVNDQYGISHVHRSNIKKGLLSIRRVGIDDKNYTKKYFDVDLLTFVGALIKIDTIKSIGLPISEYFIHEDDAEYSTRIKKVGRIVCVSNSIMTHPYGGDNAKDWIEYYTTRNYIDYIGRHYAKRYQMFAVIDKYIKKCSLIAKFVKHRSKNYRIMNKIAIEDGKLGKLGISERYKPGQAIG